MSAEPTGWTETYPCPNGGSLTETYSYTENFDSEAGLFDEIGEFTSTFEACTTQVDGANLVLDGTVKDSFEYKDRWTVSSGVETGEWNEEFEIVVSLAGSVNGAAGALVLDGALSGTESGKYVVTFEPFSYEEEGTLVVEVQRLEARFTPPVGKTLYIGQIDTILNEKFTISETSEDWTENGTINLSGRTATSGMEGAITIRTEKDLRYTESDLDSTDYCPFEGIIEISGGAGSTVEIRFGVDTGTGDAVQVVAAGGTLTQGFASCDDAEALEYFVFGPLFPIIEFFTFDGESGSGSGGDVDFKMDMSTKTASSVITFSECPDAPLGWDYSFTNDSMTLTGSDGWQTPECTTTPIETVTLTKADLESDPDIPFNCVAYPVCDLDDFNKTITGIDDDGRDFTSTYSFYEMTSELTYVKNVTFFVGGVLVSQSFTEVISIE